MMDYAKMTNDELRIEIAKRLNYIIVERNQWGEKFQVICIPSKRDQAIDWNNLDKKRLDLTYTPDWPTDIKAAWELVEEIMSHSSVINVQADHTGFTCYVRKYPTSNGNLITEWADNAPRAISISYLKWMEGEG